jgi:hypothetical protein
MDKVSFFVEEDRNRIGRKHLGRPIIHPSDIPPDARVFLALAPGIAAAIDERLRSVLPCSLVMPPPIVDQQAGSGMRQ